MSKDILGSKLFVDTLRRDHRTAASLDLQKVTAYFEKLGYEVKNISQKWRNVHALIQKKETKYFLKLASTEGISSRLINEIAFNEQLNIELEKRTMDSFLAPKIIDKGNYEKLSYYIAEYLSYPLLWDKQTRAGELPNKIKEVAKLNLNLLAIDSLKLPRDEEFTSVSLNDRVNRYFSKWNDFYSDVKEFDLAETMETLKEITKTFKPALNHCDFTPWHLLNAENKLILVDSEHASNYNPKYYDVVHFFHRMYTTGGSESIAKQYINTFRNELPDVATKNEFDQMMRPILAARIIGGFWDTKAEGRNNYDLHIKLKKEFLTKSIY